MDSKIDYILVRLVTLTITPSTLKCSSTPLLTPSPPLRPFMKLGVLRFDGKDPLGWIFKIIQFFDSQGVSDNERLTVVSFYMEGLALY